MEESILPERTREKSIPTHTKLESIEFPRSSESEVIVPCNPSGYGFILLASGDKNSLGLQNDDINRSLRRLNKVIETLLVEKKVAESKDYNAHNLFMIKLLVGIGSVLAFGMYLLTIYDVSNFSDGLIFIPLGVILVLLILSIVFMMKALAIQRDFMDIDSQISKALDTAIERENRENFSQKGCRLSKGTKFSWVAIKKVN